MRHNLLPIVALILSLMGAATQAQTSAVRSAPPVGVAEDSSQAPDRPLFGSPLEEFKDRAAIRRAEENHRENLARAKEAAQLGTELYAAFEQHHRLDREELKKLERLEKLARKIRGQAGGSDADETLHNLPRELPRALTRLAKLSDELCKSVEKTSRLVVSAAVISRSNEMIELIRHIRSFNSPR